MTDNSLNSALARIAGLAQSRKLDAAAQLAGQTLRDHPLDPVLLALAGAIEFYRGQFGRAAEHLDLALRLKPDDLTVRANLAESLFRCGREAEALALCDDRSAMADPSLRLARLGGGLAQNAGEFDKAARLYRHVVDRAPQDWAAWNNLGNALCDLGDHEAAAEALAKAVALAPDSGPIRLNLGNALIEAGRHDQAETALREAADLFPDDPQPLLSLFTFFKLSGQDEKAYDAIVEAARRAPDNADIQSDLGQEAAAANLYETAEPAFERALSLNPVLGPPYVGLASLYERMNREAMLDPLRDRAIASCADVQTLSLIDALRFKRSEQFDAAFAALEDAGDVIVAGRKHHLRGIMLDRLGQYDEAFDAFSQMNRHWLENPSLPGERGRQYREMVRACRDLVSPEWLAGWTPANPPMTRSTPVFLAGFPRSGTTLLDTMLMADPDVRVLEEENIITELEAELGGPEALPGMTEYSA